MVSRRLRIQNIADGRALLQAVAPCAGCAGCEVRCRGVFSRFTDQRPLRLPINLLPAGSAAGDQVIVEADPSQLTRLAWRAYGAVALGLMAGALTGAGMARWYGWVADVPVLLGALLGALLSAPGVLHAADPTPAFRILAASSPSTS